jgi:predicted kinase
MNEVVEKAFVEITGQDPVFRERGEGPKRVLVMSGLPFSGKSYMAKLILERIPSRVVLVRSDAVRPVIVKHMDRDVAMYNEEEHYQTFALAHELVKRAIKMEHPTIADATNLSNRFRAWAVDAAVGQGGEALVAFMRISDSTAMDRAAKGAKNQSSATPAVYALLRDEREPIEESTTPYVIIDAEKDIEPHAETLAKWLVGESNEVPDAVRP